MRMRRIALAVGASALFVTAGCRTTGSAVDLAKMPRIMTDPPDGTLAPPPAPGDLTRTYAEDRAKVAKAAFRALSGGVVGDGDFAIDGQAGKGLFARHPSVEGKVRSLRGKGPDGYPMLVEIRPEGKDCRLIVRAEPPVDQKTADAFFDRIAADLGRVAADEKATATR